ncbi:Hypp9619 [Branchiostoma lanceolatum]|uniref:Hypp9619 protein n=1 Tax=Branchiostoma lanceolatum TaxID=7740 RepID=A0A8S4MPH5_BRALA|nr:Hypp9619 [Branchiostoma lanceolatum]
MCLFHGRDVPARRRERSSQGTRSIGEWGYEARNRTPIITLGGYEEAIRDEVFSINEGLASRFPEMITFAPMSSSQLTTILETKRRQSGIVIKGQMNREDIENAISAVPLETKIQPVQLTIGDVHVADGIILLDPYPDTADQETSVVEVSLTEIAQTAEADTFAHEYVSTWSKDGDRFLKDCRRTNNTVVDRIIVTGAAMGLVMEKDRSLLTEYGGHIYDRKQWVNSLLRKVNVVKRKGRKVVRKIPDEKTRDSFY